MYATILCLLSSSQLPNVPSPLPHPVPTLPKHVLVGKWTLTWGESAYSATLFSDGQYICTNRGILWVGTWKLDKNTLTVHERIQGEEGRLIGFPFEWFVTFTPIKPKHKFDYNHLRGKMNTFPAEDEKGLIGTHIIIHLKRVREVK